MKVLGALFLLSLCSSAFAQSPPDLGDICTNCPPPTNTYAPIPYVPGLKLAVSPLSGTNLPIKLLEADAAGKYDIYYASNLASPTWSDVLQGTNGQTNFTLTFPSSGNGFFRAARTDAPITNAANVAFSFPNLFVNTNLIMVSANGGPAAGMAVLVNSTNFSDARWIPFSSIPLVLLGTNDGTYEVWFGFQGSDGTDYWSTATVTLDTTPPSIVITNPVSITTSKPILQLQGYSLEPLSSICFDVTNAAGSLTNQQGFVTAQGFDTNKFDFTTNYFQCFDVPLIQGTNLITVHATDLAGNVTTSNVIVILDFSGNTNPPMIAVTWPQDKTAISGTNFTLRGLLDNETARVTAQIVNNNVTNIVGGLVERDGKFWVENLPLASGTNILKVIAMDAA
ncbi:MAG TPA: hypothetical protein VGH42_01350 [Verrucomicrobiae bacterium]